MPQGSLTEASSAGTWRWGPGPGLFLVVVAAAALALVAWRLDWARLSALGSVHAWTLLSAAAALHLLTLPLKAVGWRVALTAVHPAAGLRWRAYVGPVAVGALFNLVLAGRVGEVARVLLVHARLLRARQPATVAVIAGSAITETVVSTIAWVALVALAGTLVPLPPVAWAVVAAVAVGAAVVAVAAWRGWGRGSRVTGAGLVVRLAAWCRRVWGAVADGYRALRRPRVLAPIGGTGLAGWIAQWGSILAVLAAFDVPDAMRAATLVLVSTSVAQTLPLVPGNLGVFQAAAALPLVASSGTAPVVAVAIGVVLQAVQSVPVALAGVVAATREGDDVRELWRAARRRDVRATGASR